MDAVQIPSETVPPEMKACEQILKRAKELKKPEPVVAYWCCFSAAQRALKVPSRSSEGTKWLMSLLDALEQMKALLSTNEAVLNEAAGAAYVENFALKVFMSADNDDRNGNTGKSTIRKFVVAGQFIEVLRCFENGMTEEMDQKLSYARWKAADGAKALREGREPAAGPPIPENDLSPFPTLPDVAPGESSSFLAGTSSSTHPFAVPSSGTSLPHQRTPQDDPPKGGDLSTSPGNAATDHLRTPTRATSSGSGAWSTVATPGLAEDGSEPHFDRSSLSAPSVAPPGAGVGPDGENDLVYPDAPTGLQRTTSNERKSVRFMGPDGAPLSPAPSSHITVESYDPPPAPAPSEFDAPSAPELEAFGAPPAIPSTPSISAPTTESSGRSRGDSLASASSSNFRPRTDGSPSLPSAPPAPPVSYPTATPSAPPRTVSALHAAPPSVPALVQAAFTPTGKQMEQSQKHARWAISALEFDDVDTARKELRNALAMLGG